MEETQLQMDLGEEVQEPTQLSQEEMIQLLSQTVVNQDKTIKQLDKELKETREELELAKKEIASIEEEQSKPTECVRSETFIIEEYLQRELRYAEAKVQELRHHLADYPEDGYSPTDLQNCLLHINYLNAMLRRLNYYDLRD